MYTNAITIIILLGISLSDSLSLSRSLGITCVQQMHSCEHFHAKFYIRIFITYGYIIWSS